MACSRSARPARHVLALARHHAASVPGARVAGVGLDGAAVAGHGRGAASLVAVDVGAHHQRIGGCGTQRQRGVGMAIGLGDVAREERDAREGDLEALVGRVTARPLLRGAVRGLQVAPVDFEVRIEQPRGGGRAGPCGHAAQRLVGLREVARAEVGPHARQLGTGLAAEFGIPAGVDREGVGPLHALARDAQEELYRCAAGLGARLLVRPHHDRTLGVVEIDLAVEDRERGGAVLGDHDLPFGAADAGGGRRRAHREALGRRARHTPAARARGLHHRALGVLRRLLAQHLHLAVVVEHLRDAVPEADLHAREAERAHEVACVERLLHVRVGPRGGALRAVLAVPLEPHDLGALGRIGAVRREHGAQRDREEGRSHRRPRMLRRSAA